MTRRLLAVLGAFAAFVLIARAETPFPVKVGPKGSGTEAKIDEGDPKVKIEDAANQQERLRRQFDDFKQALLRLAQRLENSPNQADKDKAANLKRAIKRASEQGVDTKFSSLVDSLRKENTFKDLEQLGTVLEQNEALRRDLREIMEIIMRDDRGEELRREIAEKTKLLEEIKKLIVKQEKTRASTILGRESIKASLDKQKKVSDETRGLIDPKAKRGTEAKHGEGKDSKEGKKGVGEGKDDTKDPKGENRNTEGKEGKPGDGKEGKGAEGKDGKAGEGKDGKGAEGKDGSGKEGKEGKEGEGKDGKGGEGKDGKSGEGKDGKGGEGKSGEGKDGKGGEGKDGKAGEGKEGKQGEGKDGKGGEGKGGEGKDGKGGEGKGGEGKDGKGGEGKSGEGKDGKGGDGKPGAGKEGKPGEGKGPMSKGGKGDNQPGKAGAGKPGEGKSGDSKGKGDGKGDAKGGKGGEGKAGSGKPGESKSGGKPSDSKPGEGKGGGQGQGQGQSGGGSSGGGGGGDKKQDNPVKKQIEDSNKYQKQAEDKLEQKKRESAGDEQEKAEEKLKEAAKKLEDLLKQLREEEIERLLAQLEARCRHMLALQIAVRDGTVDLDKIVQGRSDKKADRSDQQASLGLADKEDEIVKEAATALRLIEAEGSAVAFAEVFKQVHGDMITVAARLRRTDTGVVTVTIENDIIATLEEMVAALKKARQDNQNKSKSKGGGGGGQQDQKLIDQIAELKMIRSMQKRVNDRTEVYGNQYKGEQAPPPEVAKDTKEKESFETIQRELKDLSNRQEKISKVTHDIATGKNEAR